MPQARSCPVCWDERGEVVTRFSGHHSFEFSCAVCGSYRITRPALIASKHMEPHAQHLLASYLRANQGFEITTDVLMKPATLALTEASFSDKAALLLLELHRRSDHFGAHVVFDTSRDWPLIKARSQTEARHLCGFMIQRGWAQETSTSDPARSYVLKGDGWEEADRLRNQRGRSGNLAFVAMWFSADMQRAYSDGIRPALIECGYEARRVDEIHHVERIDDRIVAEIRRAALIVADFTGHRGGVYFEAGFAMGLGIPVVWTCHVDHIDDVHFDTRQYNHIVWTTPEELRSALRARIEALFPLTGRLTS